MKVKFFATIRNYTGCRQADVPVCKDMYTLLHTLSEPMAMLSEIMF